MSKITAKECQNVEYKQSWNDVIDDVADKLSERQMLIYRLIEKSVIDDVVVTANSLASQMRLSQRTIQRDLTKLKELNVIMHKGPDNGGHWIIVKGEE